MRSIDGHFTVINQPGNAVKIATELLSMFESMRSADHIIITTETIEKACQNANKVMLEMIDTYIAIIDEKFEKLNDKTTGVSYPKIEKAQDKVVEATKLAERNSTKRNWNKLDNAKKMLAKELDKAGFASYTIYADSLNVQSSQTILRKDLIAQRENYLAQRNVCLKKESKSSELTPSQIITVIAQVLSNRPKTDIGTLPIVFEDSLRNLRAETKLRALELLKSYSTQFATWYVTDDPLVLSWSGFQYEDAQIQDQNLNGIYDFELDIA